MTTHTVTLHRDDNRLSKHYGQHFYVEAVDGVTIKREVLDWNAYDRNHAYTWASGVARLYGARFVDRRPAECLYGWSSD